MMIRKLVNARIALTLGLSLAVLACTEDDPGDGADEAEETEAAQDETGDGDGDGDDSGDGDGDSGDGDGDSGDGDGDELEVIEQACADACQVIADCSLPTPQCAQWCVEAHVEATGECVETQLAVTLCIATLTCDEFEAFAESEPGARCEAENLANDDCEG